MTVLYENAIKKKSQNTKTTTNKRSLLLIVSFYPYGMKQGGLACLPAAELALEDVNSKSDLLPGFKLTLYSNDSEVCTTFLLFFQSTI